MWENVKNILKKILIFLFVLGFIVGLALPIVNDVKEAKKNRIEISYEENLGKIDLPDAYDTHSAYHPKVISFKNKWNGYKYWITYTPYPNGDDSKENPHIAVSNDMVNWKEPEGIKNPIEDVPENYEHSVVYNSDSHLVYNDETEMIECWWRYFDKKQDKIIIYRKTSKDGVKWNDKEVAIECKKSEKDYVSPAVIFENGKYEMWYVNENKVLYIESGNLKEWTEPIDMNISYKDENLLNWHLDVIHTKGKYQMVVSAFLKGHNRLHMNLYYTESTDNRNWTVAKTILKPTKGTKDWDNRGIYRSSLLYDKDTYYLFYSATDKNGNAGIGIKKIGKEI